MRHVSRRIRIARVATPALLLLAVIPTVCSASDDGDKPKRQWGEAVNDQAISIATNKGEYAPGEKIILDIRHKNVGREDVRAWLTGWWLAVYDIEVSDWNGKSVPLTLYGQRRLDTARMIGNAGSGPLHPGEEIGLCINLTRLFDLSNEDTYTVVVKRRLKFRDRKREEGAIGSNKIEIRVRDRLATTEDREFDAGRWVLPERKLSREKTGKDASKEKK
jgi:hypothetical protein